MEQLSTKIWLCLGKGYIDYGTGFSILMGGELELFPYLQSFLFLVSAFIILYVSVFLHQFEIKINLNNSSICTCVHDNKGMPKDT